ncbi:hypothetical protein COLO4_15880 [Corchorus olitorius]|uniref:glutathione transferase n=1 Tax=Corchorus olitorius TaxID=93759 RepID=A0A1R3JKV7_9ROSI|nr:hypothetical protein COLO4_15880 [Corchorus olitorius]
MANEKVKLHGFWVSPFANRVKWALKLKGIEYEYMEEDVWNKSNLLIQLNPVYKKVPVLVHNGKVILESFLILEYIDETWNQNPLLLPQDPSQRALTRFWAKFAEEKIFEAAFNALCSHGDEQKKAVQLTMEAMEKIEGELKGKQQFFGGESIGYLDIILGWISYMLPVFEEVGSVQILDPVKFPATIAWSNRFLNHPVIKDTLPPKEKMLVYFQERRHIISCANLGWIKF